MKNWVKKDKFISIYVSKRIMIIFCGVIIFCGAIIVLISSGPINNYKYQQDQLLLNPSYDSNSNSILTNENLYESCDFPIYYTVNKFDEEFNISKEKFLQSIVEAEKIWEEALGLNLFDFNESGSLKINLIFDERQETTERLKNLLAEAGSDEVQYDSFKREYDALNKILNQTDKEYKAQIVEYDDLNIKYNNLVNFYNEQKSNYEVEVNYWNTQGGAPNDKYNELLIKENDIHLIYNQLEIQEEYLKQKFDLLENKRQEFNNLVGQINITVEIMDLIAGRLNLKIEKHNQIVESRGTFNAGMYYNNFEIEIYNFFDNQTLILTLAHEFGHALGLDHASSSESVMYYLINKENKLSREDINLFKEKCGNIAN